jgi:hypothetical protein
MSAYIRIYQNWLVGIGWFVIGWFGIGWFCKYLMVWEGQGV